MRTHATRPVDGGARPRSAGGGVPRFAEALERAAGGGAPLEARTRRRMETALGADLRSARIHTGAIADALAREAGARAFTSGTDVFFAAGEYDPTSTAGRHVLAHELGHVVQQSEGPVDGAAQGSGLTVSDPHDRFEAAADAAADRVVAGEVGNPRVEPAAGSRAVAVGASAHRSVQRYGWDNIGRGLWDTAEAIPGLGNVLSTTSYFGHGAMAFGNAFGGDMAAAGGEANAAFDNLLNALPIYGNLRAGKQALENFAGGDAESLERQAKAGGDANGLIDQGLGIMGSLWDAF